MPESYRVIVTPKAFDDLNRIVDYIQQHSPQNAARTIDRLYNAAKSLDIFPRRYKIHLHRKDPGKTVHSMPVPPFIIYYRVDERTHTVRVLAVSHGAQGGTRSLG